MSIWKFELFGWQWRVDCAIPIFFLLEIVVMFAAVYSIKKAKKQSKKLQQKFELIVNLSSTNYKKPIYVKCVNKKLLNPNKKQKPYIMFFVIQMVQK